MKEQDRLLTDAESLEYWIELPNPEANHWNINGLRKAQDTKTRAETLKEAGELLGKQPEMESFDEVVDEKHRMAGGYFVSKSIVEDLKQGRIPEE